MPTVVLYGKPECHLCDEAAAILVSLERDERFDWRRVDIESDPNLYARLRYSIPIIEVQGGEALAWPTTRERVRRALDASRPAR